MGGTGLSFTQDMPGLGSNDVMGAYRSGATYAYTGPSRAYYPAMHAYGTPSYTDEFEFGLAVPTSQSVLNPEPVAMLPGQWGSGPRAKGPSFSSMYMDADTSYSGYSGAGLVQRSGSTATSDSPSFSFSGVAASLSMSSAPTPSTDRLLPNPTGRSPTLPYPTGVKPATPPSAPGASTLADVATAASYAGGFETHGLAYPPSTATSSLSSHHSSSSRTNSDTYSGTESIFGEQERHLQSQGPAFDMHSYTSEPRRDSAAGATAPTAGGGGGGGGGSGAAGGSGASGSHGSGPVVANGQPYVPGEAVHEATAHHPSQHHMATAAAAYLGDDPGSSHAHRNGQTAPASAGGGAAHADDRHAQHAPPPAAATAPVASRH